MAKSLLDAINSIGDKPLNEYWEGTNNDQIKQDIKTLMSAHADTATSTDDLKAFTLAAMQSLIINKGISTWQASRNDEGRCDDIAIAAISIARATLTELSKQQ